MNNTFKYSNDNKRYHTLSYHNKRVFGKKIFKAVVDAGFTCPNKDGTKGHGGCIFCDGGSGYFTEKSVVSVKKQIEQELERIRRKNPDAQAIAYFQANTNTYADVETLRKIYQPVINYSGIAGVSIGTRADCLSEEILDFLDQTCKGIILCSRKNIPTVPRPALSGVAHTVGIPHRFESNAMPKLNNLGFIVEA